MLAVFGKVALSMAYVPALPEVTAKLVLETVGAARIVTGNGNVAL
jgi:hypothetical protein